MTAPLSGRAAAWLPLGTGPAGAPRLYCFPNAGASATTFARWRRLAPPGVAVCPLQPPGRAGRYREPPHRGLDALLDDLTESLAGQFTGRYALYGHSMGALVVFGLARRLLAAGGPAPAGLFVSGRPAPHLPGNRRRLYDLPTEELIPELRAIGGTPEEVLDQPGLLELFLPALRADFQVNESYRAAEPEPMPIPLGVYGGTHDPRVDEAELRAWALHTSAGCDIRVYPGDHFFIVPHAADLLARMSRVLLA